MPKKHSEYFETKERLNGDVFYYIKEDDTERCKAIKNIVQQIHLNEFNGALPNDWIYQEIAYAFERLEQCETDRDYDYAICEIDAHPYTSFLIEWLKEPFAVEACDIELECGMNPDSIDQLMRAAQVNCKNRIYVQVWEFLKLERGMPND